MIDTWQAAGRRSDHFLLTTLAPRTDFAGNFPALNDGIRALAAAEGVVLIDLASHTSDDNGLTWRSSDLHVGDGVHYSESVRDWLADRIVAEMSARVSNGPHPASPRLSTTRTGSTGRATENTEVEPIVG